MTVHPQELDLFIKLLERPAIQQLLQMDCCYTMADSFLLATAFVYFKRAGLREEEYTERSFWLALYLAHDQEEDDECFKFELLPWALGEGWRTSYNSFMVAKDALWRRMDHRSLVQPRQCHQVMAVFPRSQAWNRQRTLSHGGAIRIYGEEEPYMPQGPLLPRPGCRRCPAEVREESRSLELGGDAGTDGDMESSEEELEMFSLS